MGTTNRTWREFTKNLITGSWGLVFCVAMHALVTHAVMGADAETAQQVRAQNGETKPNVIIVFCDQLRSFELGCYGHPEIQTPNIDRLASQGARFDLSVSNCPVCVPARSILLSGQHARTCVGSRLNEMDGSQNQFGRDDRRKFPDATMPEVFRQMGYHTAQVGKWHVDTRPSRMGFDTSLVTCDIFAKAKFARNEGKVFSVMDFSPDYEIKEVMKFLAQPHDRPFFMYYNIISPHMPLLDVPYKYSMLYRPEDVHLRRNVWNDGRLAYNEMWFNIYMWQKFYRGENQPLTAKVPDGFDLRNLTALYDGSVTWVDDLVGLLMASLTKQGLDANTIVLFSSDHGDMLGSHGCWNKDRLYEEAIRVPMIVRWPETIAAGLENRTQIVSLLDVMPTLIELCGGDVPASVQGQSFAPILRGEKETLDRNYAFIETPLRQFGVRTPTHMYGMLWNKEDTQIDNEEFQFFDMTEDPLQMHNMAGTAEQRDTANELKAMLKNWDKQTPRLQGVNYKPF
jgi:arylsulfatase A-like enzyme